MASEDSAAIINVLRAVSDACGVEVNTASECFDALAEAIANKKATIKSLCTLAKKLTKKAEEASLQWGISKLETWLDDASSQTTWFAKQRAPEFLLAFNIALGSPLEMELRILAESVLSNFVPPTPEALDDHLRLSSIIIQYSGSYFLSGSLACITNAIGQHKKIQFTPTPTQTEILNRQLEQIIKTESGRSIVPELSTIIKNDTLDSLKSEIEEERYRIHAEKRIFPPVIQMLEPYLKESRRLQGKVDENGKLTKSAIESSLRRTLKKQRNKAKSEARKVAQDRRVEKAEELMQKREKNRQVRREARNRAEKERTYDLNMAAQPVEQPEVEEEDSSSESSSE